MDSAVNFVLLAQAKEAAAAARSALGAETKEVVPKPLVWCVFHLLRFVCFTL